MADLKSCPFCGGKAIVAEKYGGWFVVKCKDCPCDMGRYWFLKRKLAIEAWNNRAETEEHKFTRQFIHEHGLEFALASAWERRKKDG